MFIWKEVITISVGFSPKASVHVGCNLGGKYFHCKLAVSRETAPQWVLETARYSETKHEKSAAYWSVIGYYSSFSMNVN